MNGVNFRYGKYMNGSCFSLSLVYEWGGVRGLQPHVRTQKYGKLPPPPMSPVQITEVYFILYNKHIDTNCYILYAMKVTKSVISRLEGYDTV